MDRREFIKVSGVATAGLALTGCAPKGGSAKGTTAPEIPVPDYTGRIKREVNQLKPLNIKEITVEVGAKEPFDVMHLSDTHITFADDRNDERKMLLACRRSGYMGYGEHYLDEAIRYARERGMYMMHTGDMIDFVSESNLDVTAMHMMLADWFVSAGNHEYSKYVGEAKEDEAYKDDSREAVQGAFPNDLTFASREINGVNFVAIDDVYYNFTERQHELMEEEMKKGLPVVMLCHVPLYTPEFCKSELEATNGNCAYLTGVPLEITEKFDPGKTYPAGEEWRYRKVQQRADKPTLDFIAWLKEQKQLKAILTGHMHRFFEERFSPTAIQYTVGATYNGDAQVVHFK
ncbi:MAG: metallophosphoesterase [Bacteroidales bacterium]|nr:metallophosphoesterase [Bacteroidales bacterium]